MKKIMLIGKIGCGKTTLCQQINHQSLQYKKTQTIEVIGEFLDTPGEYLENRRFGQALIVHGTEVDEIVLLQDVTCEENAFSPQMKCMFNKPMIGIVTKMDLCENKEQLKRAEMILELAGAQRTFHISSVTGESVETLLEYLNEDQTDEHISD